MPSSPSSPSSGQYAVFDIRQDPNVSTPIRPYRNANACVSCKYKKKRCEPLAGTSGPPGICQRCHDQGLQCDYHERSSNSDSSPSPTNPRTPLTSGTTNTSPTIGYMSPQYGSRPAFAASSLPLGYAGGSPSFAYFIGGLQLGSAFSWLVLVGVEPVGAVRVVGASTTCAERARVVLLTFGFGVAGWGADVVILLSVDIARVGPSPSQ
ncbi:hypothetical protein FIBSPDRAFT_1003572 [Athelia psychrophila]|uniref:Zn(2)-C6 fungal-type domain-containing protein n=1 Tax=Athelia psychrophila TaxID=1759441 RepID=A0A167WAU4_9AGAM|nr:hypothetical protein FIBSPDRAFT_1003572 [Fibularhizoctonia sp. CBS 109695]